LLDFDSVAFFDSLRKLASPNLHKCLEFVSSISEISDRVNIERVFSHTHSVLLQVNLTELILLVIVRTIALDTILKFLLLSLSGEWVSRVKSSGPILQGIKVVILFLFIHKLVLNRFVFSAVQWEIVSLPLPLKLSLAIILIFVEEATGTNLLIDDCCRLKTI
jgi:hypothetical protein